MNTGGSSSTFNKVTTYTDNSFSHTVTVADDSLVAGTIYKFKFRAQNSYGYSDYSDECEAGVSSFPAAPAAPTKNENDSGETFITLQWASSADTELPVLGYYLNVDDGYGGAKTILYDGTNQPSVFMYTASGLITGLTYTFTVQAINYNGASAESAEASFIICTKPTNLAAPFLSASTETTLTISWTAPESNGGCQVNSYYLYTNDGAGGSPTTEVDAGTINDNPTLRQHTVSFTSGDTGKSYIFKLSVENVVGTTESDTVEIVLAAVPDAPSVTPTLNLGDTSAY